MRFPVWEASDQDGTIHWYDADRQADGSYRAVVSISQSPVPHGDLPRARVCDLREWRGV
ncbi:MAG: hypothetical protein ACLTM8_10580 [Veillonella parvula]